MVEPATEVKLVKSRLSPVNGAVWVTPLPQSALIRSPAVHWVSRTKSRKVPVVVGSRVKAPVMVSPTSSTYGSAVPLTVRLVKLPVVANTLSQRVPVAPMSASPAPSWGRKSSSVPSWTVEVASKVRAPLVARIEKAVPVMLLSAIDRALV